MKRHQRYHSNPNNPQVSILNGIQQRNGQEGIIIVDQDAFLGSAWAREADKRLCELEECIYVQP